MKKALVGYTGFVGTNLSQSTRFDGLFNSKNIGEAFGVPYDLVVYSGVRAEKFLANQDPDQDRRLIEDAIENIRRLKAGFLILISTIDVYKLPRGVDEKTEIETQGLHPYGLHRFLLEKWVLENVQHAMIVRLPALYGENLKKNFIYDMVNLIPSMIRAEKFAELISQNSFPLAAYYAASGNGFYKLRDISPFERKRLKDFFQSNTFNALSFTDARSRFQFYPLTHLWNHLELTMNEGIQTLCLNSEPVSAGELYAHVFQQPFTNPLSASPADYDIHSLYAEKLGAGKDYWFDKAFILDDIKNYITEKIAL